MINQKQISRTPSADAFTQLILESFRFNGLLISVGDQLVKDFGLSSSLWQVLGAIRENPLPVAQIARNIGLTRQSVQRSANVLKNKELVRFEENPDHKRAKLVIPTKKGQKVLKQVEKIQIDWSNRIAQNLSSKELNTTVKILNTLCDRLTNNKKKGDS